MKLIKIVSTLLVISLSLILFPGMARAGAASNASGTAWPTSAICLRIFPPPPRLSMDSAW